MSFSEARFWSNVNKSGTIPVSRPELGPCWIWTLSKRPGGYGKVKVNGRMRTAHRVAYELRKGEIPHGMQVDHLCHDPKVCTPGPDCPHRACVNPDHLECVTPLENTMRSGGISAINASKQVCDNGHELNDENTYRDRDGRHCRVCRLAYCRAYRERMRAAGKSLSRKVPRYVPGTPCPEGENNYYRGCRCRTCLDAYNAYRRELRRRTREREEAAA